MKSYVEEVVLMTTTFYRSVHELRFRLALETIEAAKEAGYHMVIVDASPIEVRQQLIEAAEGSNITIYPELVRGMGPSRRQVTFLATEKAREIGAKAVFWLEAEKADMIRFVPELIQPILDGADVVVPFRTEKSWESYPSFQMEEELKQNTESSKYTGGRNLDVSFGPVMMSVATARTFILGHSANFKTWGIADTYIVPWFVTLAVCCGKKVTSVSVDFVYPPGQKAVEDHPENVEMRFKRAEQLETALKAHQILGTIDLAI